MARMMIATHGPQGGRAPKQHDVVEATIHGMAHDGRGVARIGGKTTFVDGALPGEAVRIRYLKRRSRYDTAVVEEIVRPSPDRVAPPCPHYGVCGGCSLQHLSPAGQLSAKQSIVAEHLAHIGQVEPERWLAPLAGPAWGYRRRARLGVRFVPAKGGALVGFRERRRSFITPLSECPVLDRRLSALLPGLRDTVNGQSRPDRIPQIELAAGADRMAVVVRHLEPLTTADQASWRAFAERHGVHVYVQAGGLETVTALAPANPEPLRYRLPGADVSLRFAPTDFIQINDEVNAALIDQAVRLLAPTREQRVLDLYCGLGNFTLPLSRLAGHVLGVDADPGLIARARQNAEENRCDNVEFRAADLYAEGGASPWQGPRGWDAWLLDPPRAGAMPVLKRLETESSRPRRIVYVSCYPATLARDAGFLVRALGYRLAAAGIADMFPHTSHVESVVLFERA